MRKTTIYTVALLTLFTLSFILIPSGFSQIGNVKVVSYSYYYDSSGLLEVVGEIQNTGSSILNQVTLAGRATSTTGATTDSSTRVWVQNLLPGQKAPFYMTFFTQNSNPSEQSSIVPDVAQVELAVVRADATTNYQYPDLKITSDTPKVSTDAVDKGAYYVTGTLKNTGHETAQNLRILGTFYDSSDTVTAVGGYADANDFLSVSLAPLGSVNFKIVAYDYNESLIPASQRIAGYSLLIQTEGPLLQGTGPQVTPYPTGHPAPTETTGPTDTQASTPTPGNTSSPNSTGYTPPTWAYVAVVVIVLAVIIGLVLAVKKRKPIEALKQPEKKTAAKSPKSKP